MEDYRMLHHCEQGYVLRCNGCGCMRLAFGTTAINLQEEDFYALKKTVGRVFETHRDHAHAEQKRFYIPTCEPSISLVYSLMELEALSSLLEDAHASLEIAKIIGS